VLLGWGTNSGTGNWTAWLTLHGFRITFRNWAAERTNFPREGAELALAHAVGSMTERAYQRSDLFDQRRLLAEAWAAYCSTPAPIAGNVVSLLA
jgi:hypothetical protein